MRGLYIGIDVGGTNLKAGAVDAAGRLLAVERRPLAFRDPEAFAGDLADLAEAALSDKKRAGGDITLVIPRKIGACQLRKVPVGDLLPIIRAGLEA